MTGSVHGSLARVGQPVSHSIGQSSAARANVKARVSMPALALTLACESRACRRDRAARRYRHPAPGHPTSGLSITAADRSDEWGEGHVRSSVRADADESDRSMVARRSASARGAGRAASRRGGRPRSRRARHAASAPRRSSPAGTPASSAPASGGVLQREPTAALSRNQAELSLCLFSVNDGGRRTRSRGPDRLRALAA